MKDIQLSRSAYASIAWRIATSLGITNGGDRTSESPIVDSDLLEALQDAFVIEPPNTTSDLLPLLYHIPASINPTNLTELHETRVLIRAAVEAGSIDSLLGSASLICRPWPWDRLFKRLSEKPESIERAVDGFFRLVATSWDDFMLDQYRMLSAIPLLEYETRLNELRIVERWEEQFGIPYSENGLIVVLCIGTPLISLGTNCITIGAHHSYDGLLRSIVHEVGVRIPSLSELHRSEGTKDIATGDWNGLLKLVEAEACYRKRIVFEDVFQDTDSDDMADAMKLQPLLSIRPNCPDFEDIFTHYEHWYGEAKRRCLL